jgi:hypothetical protein
MRQRIGGHTRIMPWANNAAGESTTNARILGDGVIAGEIGFEVARDEACVFEGCMFLPVDDGSSYVDWLRAQVVVKKGRLKEIEARKDESDTEEEIKQLMDDVRKLEVKIKNSSYWLG